MRLELTGEFLHLQHNVNIAERASKGDCGDTEGDGPGVASMAERSSCWSRSIVCCTSADDVKGSRRTNSSPPTRPTMSAWRKICRIVAAVVVHSADDHQQRYRRPRSTASSKAGMPGLPPRNERRRP